MVYFTIIKIFVKVALILGVAGACRSDELTKMSINDLDIKNDIIVVNIPSTKTGVSRKFVVIEPNWIEKIKKYVSMRPAESSRLFLSVRNGKITKQPIGHNTFGSMPKKIAMFLNLEDPQLYTGHCFRRTSATALALQGGGVLDLKRHGGWKSSNIAEGYVEESLESKKKKHGWFKFQKHNQVHLQ
jgi:integrase